MVVGLGYLTILRHTGQRRMVKAKRIATPEHSTAQQRLFALLPPLLLVKQPPQEPTAPVMHGGDHPSKHGPHGFGATELPTLRACRVTWS